MLNVVFTCCFFWSVELFNGSATSAISHCTLLRFRIWDFLKLQAFCTFQTTDVAVFVISHQTTTIIKKLSSKTVKI